MPMSDHERPTEPSPSDLSASADQRADDTASGKSGKKPPREAKPEFFGPGGWIAVLLPYLVMLGGLGLASYADNARVHTYLKTVANRSYAMLERVREVGANDSKLLESLDGQYGWIEYQELLQLIALGEHYELEEFRELYDQAMAVTDEQEGDLFAQLRAENDFLFKLVEYEENGQQRPIIAEGYAHEVMWAERLDMEMPSNDNQWFPADRSWYPVTYSIVLGLTFLSVLIAMPKLLRDPFRISPLAIGVGALGIVVWIGLWWLDKNVLGIASYFSGAREAFNPFEELKDRQKSDVHLPEHSLVQHGDRCAVGRGIFPCVAGLMRYIDSPYWDEEPIGRFTRLNLIGIVVYSVFSHPAEILPAIVWFGLVTWLFWKTRSIWDCVVAHVVTNLLLAIYVITTGTWELW